MKSFVLAAGVPAPMVRPSTSRQGLFWRLRRYLPAVAAVVACAAGGASPAMATPRAGVLSPNAGDTNEYVVVSGDDLGGVTQAAVTGPGGTTQTVPATGSPGDAYFRMPANAAGTASVLLYAGSTPVPPALTFTYGGGVARAAVFVPDPPLYGLTSGGYDIHLRGQQLTGTTKVTFGGVASPNVRVISDQEIVVTVPAHPTGRVDIAATTPAGVANLPAGFLYVTATAPTITAVTPNRGLVFVGGIMQVKGTGLARVTKVLVGTKAATILSKSATSIVTWAPAQNTVGGEVSVDGPDGPNLPSRVAVYSYLPS